MPIYYIDEKKGKDTKDGLSEKGAWRTSDKVNASTFDPGDRVRFKRGGEYGFLIIPSAGEINNQIIFENYGTIYDGPLPIIQGVGVAIYTNFKPHLVFRNLHVKANWVGKNLWDNIGIYISIGSENVIVRNCEIEGIVDKRIYGVVVRDAHSQILENDIHDVTVQVKINDCAGKGFPGLVACNTLRKSNTAALDHNDAIQIGNHADWLNFLIADNDIFGWQEDAIDAQGTGIIIENNHIHDAGKATSPIKEACKLWGAGEPTDAPIIFRDNWIHDIDGSGPTIRADNVQVYRNRIHNIAGHGLGVDANADIFHNEIYNCGRRAITVYNDGETITPRIQGNLLDGNEYDLRVLKDCAVKGGFNVLRNDASVTLVDGATYVGVDDDLYELSEKFVSLLITRLGNR